MIDLISQPRFLLVSMIPHTKSRQVIESEIAEAAALVETYGGTVIESITQNESHITKAMYVGKGKVEEIAELIEAHQIDVVVVNATLSASQLFTLKAVFKKRAAEIEVWDRVTLILNIFKKHARTAEAHLQIKLAETKHRGPELQGMGRGMSQQTGALGVRGGAGETQTEIMKRHWRSEIQRIEADLSKITNSRLKQMEHRKRLRLPTISIVGYTNAGKSTLFNVLTKKDVLVQDAPFATLDSTVGKLYLHGLQKEAFITDTIGFIQNLSAELIESFQSTLAETVNADLLLHVIDISDEFYPEKIETVEQVLANLGLQEKPRLFVFNKVDGVSERNKESVLLYHPEYSEHEPLFISAVSGEGIPELIAAIEKKFSSQ
jgi:GTP-binding protein HflX